MPNFVWEHSMSPDCWEFDRLEFGVVERLPWLVKMFHDDDWMPNR